MKSLEILYDYIEEPEKAKALIAQKTPLGLALAGFFAGSLSLALWKGREGSGLLFFLVTAGFFFLWDTGFSFLLAAVIHLFISISEDAELNLNQQAGSLFAYFGLADFSWALAAPVAIFSCLGPWAYWPALAMVVGIGFFNLTLKARGVRSVYGFSWTRSWMTLLLPYILSAVFLVCLFLMVAGSFLLR